MGRSGLAVVLSDFPGLTTLFSSVGRQTAWSDPRPVLARRGNTCGTVKKHHMKHASIGGGFLDYIAPDSWKSKPSVAPTLSGDAVNTGDIGTLLIPRKVPIKVGE